MTRRPLSAALALAGFAALCACARAPAPDAVASSASPPGPGPAPSSAAAQSGPPAAAAPPGASPVASASAGAGAPESPLDGLDFIDEARVLFRVAACGPTGDVPPRLDAAVVGKHCSELEQAYGEYKKGWVDVAMPFIANLRPRELPPVVVYPFGGGDLVTALATFPDATEITTISLEPAGDIRPVDKMAPGGLARELAAHRAHLERLLEKAHSRTDNLEKESQTDMPGEIVFDLGALVIHGYEPVSLRYFQLRPDGSVAYVTEADIDAAAHHPVALHALFQNAELRFRMAASGPVKTLRHIAFNLDDAHLKADGSLLAHLNPKGKVSAMTKAASHLLWNDHFSAIRGWLIDHTDWMISDSTGIPPRFAEPAGFVQDTYGIFDGPIFGLYDKRDADDLKRLFKSEPTRELEFRYGYPDQAGHAHLVVTHRGGNLADGNAKTSPAPTLSDR
jgi:hypothetical protein